MKPRYRLFLRRQSVYYAFDTQTKNFESLKTKNRADAQRLVIAMNEACRLPAMNLGLARVYLRHSDPLIAERTWQHAMDEVIKTKLGTTQQRWKVAAKDKAMDLIRDLPLIETHAEHFLRVLEQGTVSTNVHLRKLHNFSLDMNWLPWPVLPKRQWPPVRFKEKRAITETEHRNIVTWETNPERKTFYQLCWHLGASQGDLANLRAEDVDWEANTISFTRKKTGVPVVVNPGREALNILRDLPSEGPLFPNFSKLLASHRATEFRRACKRAGVNGVTLHSYRYAWAERAKVAGYPERFAQVALGHNSKAVHRAYARKAQVKIPALEEYERAQRKHVGSL